MKRILYFLLSGPLLLLLFCGCSDKPDYDQLRSEILALHNATIKAHLDKDVDFFTKNIADDYFSVGNGDIRHPSKDEINRMFTHYFNSTEFENYSDLQEPVIGFSDDGSLAWSIVKVKVAGTNKATPDSLNHFEDIWAWITLYRRDGDIWTRLGEVASINCK